MAGRRHDFTLGGSFGGWGDLVELGGRLSGTAKEDLVELGSRLGGA